jgi:hypothetical protein
LFDITTDGSCGDDVYGIAYECAFEGALTRITIRGYGFGFAGASVVAYDVTDAADDADDADAADDAVDTHDDVDNGDPPAGDGGNSVGGSNGNGGASPRKPVLFCTGGTTTHAAFVQDSHMECDVGGGRAGGLYRVVGTSDKRECLLFCFNVFVFVFVFRT